MVDNDLVTILSSLLKDIPHVSIMKKFHNTSFLIGKKVFAFTKGNGVVMKLPKGKIKELVDKENAEPLVMGKRVMQEWVIIKYKYSSESKKAFGLLKEAMSFVSLKT